MPLLVRPRMPRRPLQKFNHSPDRKEFESPDVHGAKAANDGERAGTRGQPDSAASVARQARGSRVATTQAGLLPLPQSTEIKLLGGLRRKY